MKTKFKLLLFLLSFIVVGQIDAEVKPDNLRKDEDIPKLKNPMSVEYLKKNLRKNSPRLVLSPKIEKNLKKKLKTDPVVQNMYKAIKLNVAEIQTKPLMERVMTGKRLLHVSREMLYRVNMLGIVYRIEKDPKILGRINDEVIAVCNFTDWNPSHFLDVAEMAMAVAFAIDWTAGDLSPTTVELAKTALIEKGIKASYPENRTMGWVNNTNNWNQVCNGGMIAASIAIADKDPELAAKTISRSLEGMPHALAEYGPDGVYPEGSTYWGYGTTFSVLTAAIFESAFSTDFGLVKYPSLLESAKFRVLSNAPSGWYYNYADCGDKRGENGDITLAWFATKTGNSLYYEKDRFLRPAADIGKLPRFAGAGLVWMSQYEEEEVQNVPTSWKGEGSNPIAIFTGSEGDPGNYYFGGKGGRGSSSHGNMDAGSFIFELNDVRWVIDPGNQRYHTLEKTGFDLWGKCQDCERWTLLTKNNFGHSTITVNNELHDVDGFAPLTAFKDGDNPEVAFDLSAAFDGRLTKAERRFIKDSPKSITIEDIIQTNDATETVTWQLMTTADVEVVNGGAILRQDGKGLKLENLSHPDMTVSIISLDPAPLELDRQIENLKRIELKFPAYTFEGGIGKIRVRLSGE